MLKFKITPDRFAEASNILEYLSISNSKIDLAIRMMPRFLLDDSGEYVVKVILDADGDIERYDCLNEALMLMTAVTPKRLEKLAHELVEAAKAIVNPPSAGGLNGLTSTDTPKPPGG